MLDTDSSVESDTYYEDIDLETRDRVLGDAYAYIHNNSIESAIQMICEYEQKRLVRLMLDQRTVAYAIPDYGSLPRSYSEFDENRSRIESLIRLIGLEVPDA